MFPFSLSTTSPMLTGSPVQVAIFSRKSLAPWLPPSYLGSRIGLNTPGEMAVCPPA